MSNLSATTRPQSIKKWKLIVFLLASTGAIGAATPAYVEKTVETTANPRVTISNFAGHVAVTGWDKSQVHFATSASSPQVEVDIDQLPASGRVENLHLVTHVVSPRTSGQSQNVDYSLRVPVGSSVEIRNPEGTVRIEKIDGDATVDSVGGAISVSDVSGHVALRSIGGDIELVRPDGRVEVNSVNGSLRFVAPTASRLRGSTTSGKIFYEGDFSPRGDYHLSDYSGDMEILTPTSASFDLNAKTVRGKVIADPEVSVTPRKHSSPAVYGANGLLGTHNTGAANVELTSFSGIIRIRRLH